MCESYIFKKNIFEFHALPFQRNVVEGTPALERLKLVREIWDFSFSDLCSLFQSLENWKEMQPKEELVLGDE